MLIFIKPSQHTVLANVDMKLMYGIKRYLPFIFFVLLAEFSTSPSSCGTVGCFEGGTVGVEPGAGVVTTGVVTGAVVTTVADVAVVGFGAAVGFDPAADIQVKSVK